MSVCLTPCLEHPSRLVGPALSPGAHPPQLELSNNWSTHITRCPICNMLHIWCACEHSLTDAFCQTFWRLLALHTTLFPSHSSLSCPLFPSTSHCYAGSTHLASLSLWLAHSDGHKRQWLKFNQWWTEEGPAQDFHQIKRHTLTKCSQCMRGYRPEWM